MSKRSQSSIKWNPRDGEDYFGYSNEGLWNIEYLGPKHYKLTLDPYWKKKTAGPVVELGLHKAVGTAKQIAALYSKRR